MKQSSLPVKYEIFIEHINATNLQQSKIDLTISFVVLIALYPHILKRVLKRDLDNRISMSYIQ